MRFEIFTVLSILLLGSLGLTYYYPAYHVVPIVIGLLYLRAIADVLQKKRVIIRNFPILGHFRYLLEMIRPEIQQYFIESETEGRPIARVFRSLIYQRAKRQMETVAFGTQLDVYADNYEWIEHSMQPAKITEDSLRVLIGEKQCQQPYSASLLNISAMSYGSLSKTAIQALNRGAAKGHFYHNTGEGGISPYHLEGGDLVWQIGTGYFGCRDKNGNFDSKLFESNATKDAVKMIEVKLSQGAKPGHGGILPGTKVDEEIASIRHVEVGKTVHSPATHSAFSNSYEMLSFCQELRELSGGKPVGIKLCIGKRSEFHDICKTMQDTGLLVDFITVDGGEGGTGAAPLELTNNVGTPLEDGLTFVDDCLRSYGLRQDIKIIAAGKVFSAFHVFKRLALGADLVCAARSMMLAIGCIQALRCNTNHCPSGVATTLPKYYKGIDVPDKAERVANYHSRTMDAFRELCEVAGYDHPSKIERASVQIRLENRKTSNFAELYPQQ